MITLYTLPASFGQRNPSPFCLKTEMALTHLGLPFRIETTLNLGKAPKGKVPWIDDEGTIIADSELILAHLDRKTNGGLFGDLTPAEVALGTAFSRLAEDHLYWLIVSSRWLDDRWFEVVKRDFFSTLPFPLNKLVPLYARSQVRRTIHLHGLGRHTMDEQREFARRDLAAFSARVADGSYIASRRMTVHDFTVASLLACALTNRPDTWVSELANREFQELQEYIARVQSQTGVYCVEPG